MLARQSEELFRMRSGLPGFAADAGKTALIGMRPRDCRKVTALPGEAERAVQQVNPLIYFPEGPQDYSQPAGGYDFVIEDEPGGKMLIPLALIGCEGLFKVHPRPDVIALEPASYAKDVHRAPPLAIRASAGRRAGKPPPPRASARGRREQSLPTTCRNRPRSSRRCLRSPRLVRGRAQTQQSSPAGCALDHEVMHDRTWSAAAAGGVAGQDHRPVPRLG